MRRNVLWATIILPLLAVLLPAEAAAESAEYWEEAVCNFTPEGGDDSVLVDLEDRQYRVSNVGQGDLAGATAQTLHDFGLVIREFAVTEGSTVIKAWRYLRKADRTNAARGLVLQIDLTAPGEGENDQHLSLTPLLYGSLTVRDPCLYNTFIAYLVKNLPSGSEVSKADAPG